MDVPSTTHTRTPWNATRSRSSDRRLPVSDSRHSEDRNQSQETRQTKTSPKSSSESTIRVRGWVKPTSYSLCWRCSILGSAIASKSRPKRCQRMEHRGRVSTKSAQPGTSIVHPDEDLGDVLVSSASPSIEPAVFRMSAVLGNRYSAIVSSIQVAFDGVLVRFVDRTSSVAESADQSQQSVRYQRGHLPKLGRNSGSFSIAASATSKSPSRGRNAMATLRARGSCRPAGLSLITASERSEALLPVDNKCQRMHRDSSCSRLFVCPGLPQHQRANCREARVEQVPNLGVLPDERPACLEAQ